MQKTFISIIVILLVSCGVKNREEHYFLKAEECYTNKQYEKSIKYIEKAIAINSENDVNFFALAKVYKEMGKYDRAMQAINKALQLNPIHEYYFQKSLLYSHLKDYNNALNVVEKAINLSGIELYKEYQASFYMFNGQYDLAIDEFNKLYDNGYNFNEPSQLNYVNMLIDKEFYTKAMVVINTALESDSLNPKYLHQKGLIYFGMAEYKNAIQTFQKAINNCDDEIGLREDSCFFIAESNFLLGNYEASIQGFNELIKEMLQNKEIYLKDKIYQNASDFFDTLLMYYAYLCNKLDKVEDYSKLQETLKTMISYIEKENIEIMDNYSTAIIYYLVPINDYKLNETDKAISNYRKALKLDMEYNGDLEKLSEVWFLEDNIEILRKIAKMAKT
jgi:tetratricopeptide (TPR) repeat protein